MSVDLAKIESDLILVTNELIEKAELKKGDLVVLGCSTSEVVGGYIGKDSSLETGEVIVKTIYKILNEHQINLAIQGCEHINRALTIEKEVALKHNFEIVSVVPALHAGGACSYVAYGLFKDPVVVEHIVAQAGLDIGDTSIGMHVKHVQVPLRLSLKELGCAHMTFLKTRPKLIGGPRAQYTYDK